MLARALLIFLVLTLGGCSISGSIPDWMSEDVAGPEPAYRFLIANGIVSGVSVASTIPVLGAEATTNRVTVTRSIFGDPATAGTFDISGARRVDSHKGAAWLICVRTQRIPSPPRYHAVLIQSRHIVDAGLSVVADQCELQSYSPFDWMADANNPPVR